MSASVTGSGGSGVNLLMLRKAMEAHKSNAAQLLGGTKPEPPPPPPAVTAPVPTGRTWYL